MKARLKSLLIATLAAMLTGCAGVLAPLEHPPQPPAYDYPIDNPYAATVIGTPPAFRWHGGKQKMPDERRLVVFPDRVIPEGFWYYDGLLYGEMLQDKPAPLVYIIGGTGSGYKSRYSVTLANMLYRSGYHVVMLPSTTHANFIVTASEGFYAGNPQDDARDLYRVIGLIHRKLADRDVKVTATGLTGYSLGAWHAVFVTKLDADRRAIGFDRTLLINPPLNLYSSLRRLDAMIYKDLPQGVDGLDAFIDKTLTHLSRLRKDSDAFDFSNENLLYEAYLKIRPSDASLQTTIGLAFRFAAANMIFSTDVMDHAGYIYPKDRPFLSATPLNGYLAVALRTGFEDYFKDIYADYCRRTRPDVTVDALAGELDLGRLGGWISHNRQIGMIGNSDDIILGAGEMDRLRLLFGKRAVVFPHGGHLGNIEHPAFAWHVVDFFRGMGS